MSERRELSDTRLSYSSYQLLKGCERRYWHYKVNNTPVDTDFPDERESLTLGKAFHSLLEGVKHNPKVEKELMNGIIAQVRDHYQLEEDKTALIVAMAKQYLLLRDMHPVFSTLAPVAIEYKIEDTDFLGFIDVIFSDIEGYWYIGDLKTTSRQSDSIKARLELDTQLHLYTSYVGKIASELGLNPDRFKGCLYMSVNKTTTKRKVEEPLASYVKRLQGAIEARVYVVPMDADKTKAIRSDFTRLYNVSMKLREEGTESYQNLSYCENYFTPCPYFSKCHGHNYTEAKLETWSTELDK